MKIDKKEPEQPVEQEFKISYREFMESLIGVDYLIGAGMKLEYGSRKMIMSEWVKEHIKFGKREVK